MIRVIIQGSKESKKLEVKVVMLRQILVVIIVIMIGVIILIVIVEVILMMASMMASIAHHHFSNRHQVLEICCQQLFKRIYKLLGRFYISVYM